MTSRCDVVNTRLFGETESGIYLDIQYQCMKPTCERCWKPLTNRRIWATRLALAKLGVSTVWIGLLDDRERRIARHWKEYNKDKLTIPVANMLTTYQMTDKVGLLATCKMVPTGDYLTEIEVEDGLATYYRWAVDYRPKRMTADWELKLPGIFRGKFTASPITISRMWRELDERWGYKPGDIPDDSEAFERRMYLVIDELRNSNRNRDELYND